MYQNLKSLKMAKLFELPNHKRYNYKPRFYNEQAELRKRRQEILKREHDLDNGTGERQSLVKKQMGNYIKMARKTRKKSNLRVFIILIILLLLSYFMVIH